MAGDVLEAVGTSGDLREEEHLQVVQVLQDGVDSLPELSQRQLLQKVTSRQILQRHHLKSFHFSDSHYDKGSLIVLQQRQRIAEA